MQRSLSLITIAFLLVTGRPTLASDNECAKALLPNIDPISIDLSGALEGPTVTVLGAKPGPHGGQLIRLRNTSTKWLSKHSEFFFDVQGDPRFFIGTAGTKTARFFGFEVLEPKHMTIPNVNELNGAVAKLNPQLIKMGYEPIPLNFSHNPLDSTSMSRYLDRFTEGLLPMAPDGHHLVHDMSFHSGAVFLPPRLIQVAQKRVQFIRKFVSFLIGDTQVFNSEQAAAIKRISNFFLVRSIDDGTAFTNLFLLASRSTDPVLLKKISSLAAKISNSTMTLGAFEILPGIPLVLGTIEDEYFLNENIKVLMLNRQRQPHRLRDNAISLVAPILFQAPEKLSGPKNGTPLFLDPLTNEGALFNSLFHMYAEFFPKHSLFDYLYKKMDLFCEEVGLSVCNQDLAQTLFPDLNYKFIQDGGTRLAVTTENRDALTDEMLNRLKQIQEAVSALND